MYFYVLILKPRFHLADGMNCIAATKISTPCKTRDAVLILNRISQQHRLMHFKHQLEVASCHTSVGSCTHMVFSGYWVGPDIDDGWGLVEAFVYRI